jgi:hypothetical protein
LQVGAFLLFLLVLEFKFVSVEFLGERELRPCCSNAGLRFRTVRQIILFHLF